MTVTMTRLLARGTYWELPPGPHRRRLDVQTGRTVRRCRRELLDYLAGLASAHGATTCFPSYETIREGMSEFHGWRVSVRTIARHLAAAVRDLYLKRRVRHCPDPKRERGWLHRSTLYQVTGRWHGQVKRIIGTVTRWQQALSRARTGDPGLSRRLPYLAEYLRVFNENTRYRRRQSGAPPPATA